MRFAILGAVAIAALCAATARADSASDALIHSDAAHAAGLTGKGVVVAVLDTGIDDRVPGIVHTIAAEHCLVPPDGCPNGTGEQDGPGSAQDDHGHGTEVSSVLASVAPDASFVVVKVADRNGRTSSTQIMAGLDWVRTQHPEAKIVNVSLAGDIPLIGDCTTLTSALQTYAASIDARHDQGASVFAAAGNNGRHNGIAAPGCFPDTVTVGAVYSKSVGAFLAPDICRDDTTTPDQVACWSNSSAELDLLAPGAPIDVTGLGGANSSLAGTSAASAAAAGAAALLLEADPTLTPDALLAKLERTGRPLTDLRANRTTPRIDITAALGLAPTPTVPKAGVSTTQIAFGTVRRSKAIVKKLVIRNSGDGALAVRIATSLRSVTVRPAKLTVKPGQRTTVTVTFRPTRAGAYRGAATLATDDPSQPTLTVALRGTGR